MTTVGERGTTIFREVLILGCHAGAFLARLEILVTAGVVGFTALW